MFVANKNGSFSALQLIKIYNQIKSLTKKLLILLISSK